MTDDSNIVAEVQKQEDGKERSSEKPCRSAAQGKFSYGVVRLHKVTGKGTKYNSYDIEYNKQHYYRPNYIFDFLK